MPPKRENSEERHPDKNDPLPFRVTMTRETELWLTPYKNPSPDQNRTQVLEPGRRTGARKEGVNLTPKKRERGHLTTLPGGGGKKLPHSSSPAFQEKPK